MPMLHYRSRSWYDKQKQTKRPVNETASEIILLTAKTVTGYNDTEHRARKDRQQ